MFGKTGSWKFHIGKINMFVYSFVQMNYDIAFLKNYQKIIVFHFIDL